MYVNDPNNPILQLVMHNHQLPSIMPSYVTDRPRRSPMHVSSGPGSESADLSTPHNQVHRYTLHHLFVSRHSDYVGGDG